MSKLAAALAWAARGFRVFPLWPNSNTPFIDDYATRATKDPVIITGWFHDCDNNIGCVPQDQIMVDLDVKKGHRGPEVYQSLGLPLWSTLTVRTVSGGLHLYFSGPATANSAGRIGDGIDTRGPNGYVVAPGSTINGAVYELIYDVPVQPVPQLVLDRLRAPRQRDGDQSPLIEMDTPSALLLGQRYLEDLNGATAGTQNNTLFTVAAQMRDLAVSELAAAELIEERWLDKCSPAIEPDTMRAIVANAYLYAQNQPGMKHPLVDFGEVVAPPPEEQAIGMYVPEASSISDNPFMNFGNMTPLAFLKPRPWVLHRFLLRGEVTTLLAPGGVGKSQLMLTAAMCLALGWPDLLGFKNHYVGTPQKSIIYNAEDSEDEMSMRLHASCLALHLDPELVRPHIVLVSGQTLRMKFLVGGHQPVVDDEAKRALVWLIEAALHHDAIMIGIDPLNKIHEVDENNSTHMSRLMELLKGLGIRSNAAILVAHHISKPGFGGVSHAGSANASRGSGEIINGSRAAFTLTNPTDDDALRLSLDPEQRRMFLRLDDAKMNRTLMGDQPVWVQKVSVQLPNGEEVGAFMGADMKQVSATARLTIGELIYSQQMIHGSSTIPMAHAIKLMKQMDPLCLQMSDTVIRGRLQQVFYRPIEVSSGNQIRLDTVGRTQVILIE